MTVDVPSADFTIVDDTTITFSIPAPTFVTPAGTELYDVIVTPNAGAPVTLATGIAVT